MGAPDAGAAFAAAAPVRIVLMHAPSGLLDVGAHPFAVALCGHTHGGQIALPNGWPVLTACGPLSRRYTAGRYALDEGRTLLVSRGVGYTALPIRLNAPPSITLCTIDARRDRHFAGGVFFSQLIEPAEDGLVPQHAVGRLQHPVVLVREVEEPARDALALQRGEGRHALGVDDAVVAAAVDDEHRRLPLGDVVDRVVLA